MDSGNSIPKANIYALMYRVMNPVVHMYEQNFRHVLRLPSTDPELPTLTHVTTC